MSLYSYSLQIEKYQDAILEAIEMHKVTIIKGPTGCGKSTFIPFLLRGKKVAIIEPRRIAVTALYNTLSEKIENLGYKMRFSKQVAEGTTMVIFTDGAFLNTIEDHNYDYIIVDEVHERSLRTDLILSYLKTNYKNKLILMSATLNTNLLENFFGAFLYEIPGESYPADVRYLDIPTSDYIMESYLTVKNIIKTRDKNEKKDILVFLPGEDDINDLFKLCKKLPAVVTCKVHSTMSDKDQLKIYESSECTKLILSTNICEASLTIPNIKYVIDTGLQKAKIFDGISSLGIVPISRDSAIQRLGRCNRLGPGVCFRLYTASQILPQYTPEIMRSDLTSAILTIISWKKNIFTFEFIDYPPLTNVQNALEFLVSKKCMVIFYKSTKYTDFKSFEDVVGKTIEYVDIKSVIKNLSFRTTSYGIRLLRHPFDVHLAHFYEECIEANVGYFGGIIVSLISQENYNFMNGEGEKRSDLEHLVDIFENYIAAQDKLEYCNKTGVPFKGMETASRVFKQLNHSREGGMDLVMQIFSRCFEHNMCTRNKDGSYRHHRLEKDIWIHPTSGFFRRKDKKIAVVDVFCSTKAYGRIFGTYYSIN